MKIKKLGILSILSGLLLAHAGLSSAFTVDKSSLNGPMTGLWDTANESGWGGTITHQYDKIFAAIYTYESNGTPVWYTASDCPVIGGGCSGTLYKVTNGSPLTSPWNGAHLAVTPIGNIVFSFSDANSGSASYTINGIQGSKNISKFIFASPPVDGGGTVAASCTAANFTLAKFNAIVPGVSLNQVRQIIGCEGSVMSRYPNSFNYAWEFDRGNFLPYGIYVSFDLNDIKTGVATAIGF